MATGGAGIAGGEEVLRVGRATVERADREVARLAVPAVGEVAAEDRGDVGGVLLEEELELEAGLGGRRGAGLVEVDHCGAVVGGAVQGGLDPVGVASSVHQLAGLGDVAVEENARVLAFKGLTELAEVLGVHPVRRQLRDAAVPLAPPGVVGRGEDAVAVHGQRERLAHPHIVPGRDREVEVEPAGHGVERVDHAVVIDLRRSIAGLLVDRRRELREVQRAVAQRRDQHIGVAVHRGGDAVHQGQVL